MEGKYPLRPALPGVPGHEGLGVVLAVGDKVRFAAEKIDGNYTLTAIVKAP